MVSSVSSLYGTTLHNGGVANTATTSSSDAFAATMAEVSAEEEAAKKTAQAKAQTTSATGGSSSSAGAASAQSASWLLPEDAAPSTAKPSLAKFIDATGTDFTTASSLLYGTMGSNEDRRDWTAIMASGDPVAAARAGTGQMYGRPIDAAPLTAVGNTSQNVLASSGNYVVLDKSLSDSPSTQGELALVDSEGGLLRKLSWNAPTILSASRDFGFDTSALNGLADQLDAKGIQYKPYELYDGSDAGVDLRDLAAGGLGSAYDWRVDANAEAKGESAVRSVANNLLLAQELGITGTVLSRSYGAGQGGSTAATGTGTDSTNTGTGVSSTDTGSDDATATADLARAIQSYASRYGTSALNNAFNDAWSSLKQ